MRKFRAWLSLCLMAIMLCTSALADAPLLRHADGWDLSQTPLSITLHANVSVHMPYDDDRLSMLKTIIDKMTFRIHTEGAEKGSVSLLVGNTQLVTLASAGDEVQLSCMPGTAFRSADGFAKVLGSDAVTVDFSSYGILNEGEGLLEDGWQLLNGMLSELENYGQRTKNTTSIKDMGKASFRIDATIPSSAAFELKPLLLAYCPDGALYDALNDLSFEGKQTFRIYLTSKEVPLRIEYNGTCGKDGDLRTVQFIWRMRRDETYRDEVTLTTETSDPERSEAFVYERMTQTSKKGVVSTEGQISFTSKVGKEKTEQGLVFDLQNAPTEEADVLTGSVTLSRKEAGQDKTVSTVLVPDLIVSGTEEAPFIAGTLTVTENTGKNVTEEAVLYIDLARGNGVAWSDAEEIIDLDSLSDEDRALTLQRVSRAITSSIVRPLIIFLGSEGEWFFRDLSPEAVTNILDAASSFILIE